MTEGEKRFTLSVERLGRRLANRYLWAVCAERFKGPGTMDDLPLYQMARRQWKRLRKLRAKEFPRRLMEPPPGLEDRMEHKTPQFFLRNIPRVERSAPDEPEFDVSYVRDREAEATLQALRKMRYKPPEFLKEWNIERVVELREMLKVLVEKEDWTRRFGREIKERIRGPLYKYDPDAAED